MLYDQLRVVYKLTRERLKIQEFGRKGSNCLNQFILKFILCEYAREKKRKRLHLQTLDLSHSASLCTSQMFVAGSH